MVNSASDLTYGSRSFSQTNGECVTAIMPLHIPGPNMSGRNRRCQGTDKDSSGSSMTTKNGLAPEKYKCENNDTICFSPEDSIFSSNASSCWPSADRTCLSSAMNVVYLVLS